MFEQQLEFAVATHDINAAKQLAQDLAGRVYIDNRPDPSKLPFAALATVVSDDLGLLQRHADVGLYVICRRIMKSGSANKYGLFPLIHHPDLTHAEADAHWRDKHTPLALEHHPAMTHYMQLSVVTTLSGPDIDGFALCGFNSLEDLKTRFFRDAESEQIINGDVHKFANTKNSPRRLIADVVEY